MTLVHTTGTEPGLLGPAAPWPLPHPPRRTRGPPDDRRRHRLRRHLRSGRAGTGAGRALLGTGLRAAHRHRMGPGRSRDLRVRPDRARQRLRFAGRPAADPRPGHRRSTSRRTATPRAAALPRRPDPARRGTLALLPAHLPPRHGRGAARAHRDRGGRRHRARIRARRTAGEPAVLAAALPPGGALRLGPRTAPGAGRARSRRTGSPNTGTASSRSPCAPVPRWPPPTAPSCSRSWCATSPAAVACRSASRPSSHPTGWATASTSI